MYGCTIYWKDRSFQFAIAVHDTLIVVMNQYSTVQLDKATRTIQPSLVGLATGVCPNISQ